MIKKIVNFNETLLSFLCGIFSNIPISLLFAVTGYGETQTEQVYFWLWIASFVFSVALTVFAFMFTIKQISIKKQVDNVQGETAKNAVIAKNAKYKGYFIFCIIAFFFALAFLIASAVGLWVVINFI